MMRGLFSIVLATLFLALIVSLYMDYSQVIDLSTGFYWYLARLREYHIRRDLEFSLGKAFDYALLQGPEGMDERARFYFSRWANAWRGIVDLDVNEECIVTGREGNYIYAVLTCPIEGNIGRTIIYIPSGFRRELRWIGG